MKERKNGNKEDLRDLTIWLYMKRKEKESWMRHIMKYVINTAYM